MKHLLKRIRNRIGLLALLALTLPAVGGDKSLNELNQLWRANLNRAKVPPAPRLSDSVFARRAYLTVLGRIPTLAELNAFLAAPDRGALIDALHEKPGRLSHDFNWWADLLRLKDKVAGVPATSTRAYANWLRTALAENRPYDQMVRELITAQGYAGNNGAVGFYQRDRGMPLDQLANTAQTFLGTRLGCAQCHDHPFEDWTQMQFFQLAAFSSPVEVLSLPTSLSEQIPAIHEHMTRRERTIGAQSFAAITRPFRNAIVAETSRPLKLPHDYQYDDAKPKDIVKPAVPFGPKISSNGNPSPAKSYATWMTDPANPRFAKVMVNRLWKRIMGVGILEPVDDLDGAKAIGDPAMLEMLTRILMEVEFDLIAFKKLLLRSEPFQRRSVAYDLTSGNGFAFPGPMHRRMNSEQIWDSVAVLIRDDLDETIRRQHVEVTDALERSVHNAVKANDLLALLKRSREIAQHIEDAAKVTEKFRRELSNFGKQDKKQAAAWLERVITQTDRDLAAYSELTFLGHGPEPARQMVTPYLNIRQQMVQVALKTFPELKPRYVDYFFSHHASSIASRKDKAAKAAIQTEYATRLKRDGRREAERFRLAAHQKRRLQKFLRASEYGNPSPEVHLLREFGQSDRELINNSSLETSIPQMLELRNGRIAGELYNPQSSIQRQLTGIKESDAIVRNLFLQMLSRPPTKEELTIFEQEFRPRIDSGIRNVIWVLLNSAEFVYPR